MTLVIYADNTWARIALASPCIRDRYRVMLNNRQYIQHPARQYIQHPLRRRFSSSLCAELVLVLRKALHTERYLVVYSH